MNIGDKVKIVNTGDVWEGKSGILEYLDDYVATILVDFIDDKKVRQDFNVDNLVSIDAPEEPVTIPTDEESPKLKEDLNMNVEELKQKLPDELKEDINMNVEELKQKLADYLEIDVDDIDQGYNEDIFTVDGGEREYLVCDEDEARLKAEEEVRQAFEDMGLEAFTEQFQDWILENAVDGSVFSDTQYEYYMGYVDDIEDEDDDEFNNRLYRELFENGLLEEDDFVDEDYVGSELKDEVYTHLEDLKADYVKILCDTEDPMDFIRGIYSGKDLADFIMENNAIDIDEVAREAVDEDGIAHFIAYYDGESIDLGGGIFAYRLN